MLHWISTSSDKHVVQVSESQSQRSSETKTASQLAAKQNLCSRMLSEDTKAMVPKEDEGSFMQNSAVGLSWYLLQGWSRDTDLESVRAWRRDRPLFMSTPSTEQGQILYCYGLVIPSWIKTGSCFKPEHIKKLPSEIDGDFPFFHHIWCEKDQPIAIVQSSLWLTPHCHVQGQQCLPLAQPGPEWDASWAGSWAEGAGFQQADTQMDLDTAPL